MNAAVGLVARADDTGLGNQSLELHRRIRPAKTLVVDLHGLSASGKDLTSHPERFPHGRVDTVHGIPGDALLDDWLDGLDTVLTLETPYNHALYGLARRKGVRSVLQGNFELLDYLQPGPHHDHPPDVLALPSTWRLAEAESLLGAAMEVTYLPVPLPDRHAANDPPPEVATRWLHPVGWPALSDRNGTRSLLRSLAHVRSKVTVTLTCQQPGWLGSLVGPGATPRNVTLVIETDPPSDWRDLYRGHHAVVLPRRYGGLCLPANEAVAGGLPVVMTDVEPNRSWLPRWWLAESRHEDTVMTKTLVEVHGADPASLASRIDLLSTDVECYSGAVAETRAIHRRFSWDELEPLYRRVLGG